MRRSFHEHGNDLWIREIVYPEKTEGFFVELGACDGRSQSSCFMLEQLGWRGICLEPHSEYFPRLVENRPQSFCLQACLYEFDTDVEFAEVPFAKSGSHPMMSGIGDYLTRYRPWDSAVTIAASQTCTRRGITLQTLLTETDAPATIDFMAVDIEAADRTFLQQLATSQRQIGALAIELTRGTFPFDLFPDFKSVANPFKTGAPWEQYFVHYSLAEMVESRTAALSDFSFSVE